MASENGAKGKLFPLFHIPRDSIVGSTDTESDTTEILELKSTSEHVGLEIFPRCVLNCLYDQFLLNGCDHNNHQCFCIQMTAILLEPHVQLCLRGCSYLSEQLYAKEAITNFCAVQGDGITIQYPSFMLEHHEMHRRSISDGSTASLPPQTSSVSSNKQLPPSTPTQILFTTTITRSSWGVAPTTSTAPSNPDGTVNVIVYIENTSILRTFFSTTTVPASAKPYTSTFTDQQSPAITEIIGVNIASKTNSQPPSNTLSSSTSSTHTKSPSTYVTYVPDNSGIQTYQQIIIGTIVPFVFLLLFGIGVWLFLRRRKRNRAYTQAARQETHDGGLPEPMSAMKDLPYIKSSPPSYMHEAGGVPIHEMNNDQQRYDGNGNPLPLSHELNAEHQHDARDGSHYAGHELTADPPQARVAARSPSAVGRKAVSTPEPSTASFPAPWDSAGAAAYEQQLNIGPIEAAAAEDSELAQLEKEVAKVKRKKERIQELQMLEAREEELRRSISERKRLATSKS